MILCLHFTLKNFATLFSIDEIMKADRQTLIHIHDRLDIAIKRFINSKLRRNIILTNILPLYC